jgi:hypothetical protein
MEKLMEIIKSALEHSMHVEISANWRHFDPLDSRRSVTFIVYDGIDIVETRRVEIDDSEEEERGVHDVVLECLNGSDASSVLSALREWLEGLPDGCRQGTASDMQGLASLFDDDEEEVTP